MPSMQVYSLAFLLLAQKVTSVCWHDSVAGWLFQTAYRLSLRAKHKARRRSRYEARAKPARFKTEVKERH